MVIVVMGLPGSGKSYFAKKLSDKIGARYIGSDALRKEMKAMGKYGVEDKGRVYDRMVLLAGEGISHRETVVLDATFYKNSLLKKVVSLAQQNGVPHLVFWIVAEEEVIKERVSKERSDSEADYGVYLKLAEEFEEPPQPFLKVVSTQDNIKDMLEQADDYIKRLG